MKVFASSTKCLILVAVLLGYAAQATESESTRATTPKSGMDSQASMSAEEYPVGGIVTATVGYGQLLWNKSEAASYANESDFNSSPSWLYGYVRPEFELKTTALTNRLTGTLQFFPVSILGLSGGGGVDFRNYNSFSGVDCSKLMCDEALYFRFAQAQLIGGFDKFAAVVTGRYDWLHAQSSNRPFYDYMSYLIGRTGNDDLRGLTVLVLYRKSEAWNFGILAMYQDMIFSHSNNGSLYALASRKEGPWQASVGLGEYRSDHQVERPSAIFLLEYTSQKSVGLF